MSYTRIGADVIGQGVSSPSSISSLQQLQQGTTGPSNYGTSSGGSSVASMFKRLFESVTGGAKTGAMNYVSSKLNSGSGVAAPPPAPSSGLPLGKIAIGAALIGGAVLLVRRKGR
jgi:hypothetical protein